MTYPIHPKQVARIKKHERSIYRRKIAPDLLLVSGFASAERVFSQLHLPAWHLLGLTLRAQWRQWRERAAARRHLASLADLDRRALADLGMSRGQAFFLSTRPGAAQAACTQAASAAQQAMD